MLISFEGPITIDADRFPGRCVIEIDDIVCVNGTFKPDPACGVVRTIFSGEDVPLKRRVIQHRTRYEFPLVSSNESMRSYDFRVTTTFQSGKATIAYTAHLLEYRKGRWSFSYTRCGDGTATVVVIPPVKRAR